MEPATPKRPFAEVEPLNNDPAFKRFRDNLPPQEDPNSKEAFRLFLNKAGDELVKKYLDNLDSFSRDLLQGTVLTKETIRPIWAAFLAGDMPLEGFCRQLQVDDQSLKDRAVRLAFLRNHPGYSTNEAITVPQMSEALKCRDNEAELYLKSLLNEPAREALASGISVEIIKKGYDGDFLKSDTILKPLLEKLRKQAAMWDENNYHSPYTSLVGPTTCGKTRSLGKLSEHVCVVYICLRNKDSDGQPPRSALASSMTPDTVADLTNYYESFLIAIFEVVTEFFSKRKEVTDFSKAVSKKIDHHYGSFQKNPNNKASTLLKQAAVDMFTQTEVIHPSFNVLLAIDEARALLSSPKKMPNEFSFFRNFCRALQHIPPNKGFFTILADTTLQVANFNPAPKYDPSARGGLEKGVRLFDPIYQISSLDVLVPTNSPTSWNELTSAARLVNYGTPVYGAYWRDAQAESMNRSEVFSHIISLAQSKLLCSNQLPLPQNLTEYQALALLDKEMLICCIKKLTATLRLGLDARGVAGELASRIILSCAMREAMRKSKEDPVEIPYGRSVRLADFLNALTGRSEDELELGFDQLFTIYLKRGNTLDEQNITFCGVQVKNTTTKPNFARDDRKWTDESSDVKIPKANPYLVLFMSLKTEGDMAPLQPKDAQRASQVFHGFKGYACLPEGVAEALEEMIQVEPDLRSLHQDQHGREYAHTINPLVYTGPQS
ncbi:hypothetical protein PTTG_00009 [Puccinia triticina 1-1 BBBD Race 1]|uniref:Uncharacterized protein n=1 Tax=Puccinia triticina (isolate 1-1 / race 1 (BBBD)) TaxID=630390 RepID=A0A180GBY2_PUCT1|nr:hypothetical protein PTTG_00009 [Puccinia triticina 1-1 BBBD Race 1]